MHSQAGNTVNREWFVGVDFAEVAVAELGRDQCKADIRVNLGLQKVVLLFRLRFGAANDNRHAGHQQKPLGSVRT